MTDRSYLVPARAVEVEIEVKRSRFLCTLRRVESEPDARALVESLRKTHWDARHTCSAFRIGASPQPVERSSDDGEPAGTAGAPMLEVVRGAGLSDVCVVVTRWFGGTLLGTGGLARAYGDAVRAAVAASGVRRRTLLDVHEFSCDHQAAGRIESALRSAGLAVLEVRYADVVTFRIGATGRQVSELGRLVAILTGGGADLRPMPGLWVDQDG